MLGTVLWDKRNKAFTLVGSLIVVSVIVLLAAVLMPLIGNGIKDAKKLRV
jgi:type II secretory pathway pseudopilin PulG